MATVNLGRIKPIWKGAWSNSTAYVVDDMVSHSNQSYICIQAGTNQNPSTATAYWSIMAAKGTDGTDVGATLTTQGDVLYRDGSGIQRLAKPASDMYLKNTSGGVVSWAALSSDFVKLASVNQTSDTAGINFEGFIDNSTYSSYYLKVRGLRTNAYNTTMRMLTGTNTEYSASNTYRHASHGRNNNQDGYNEENERWRFAAGYHANTGHGSKGCMLDLWLDADANKAATFNAMWCNPFYNSNADRVVFNAAGGVNVTDQTWTGIRLYADGGTIHNAKCELYGLK